jgi:putative acetyltransferase
MLVTREAFEQPEVRELLHLADSYTASLYPPEGRTPFSVADVKKANSIFLVARDHRYRPVGCVAALDRGDDTGEIKRLFVKAACALLETGPKNVEAIKLYERLGYVERDPFYPHLASPYSVFMEKMIVH